MAWMQSWPNWQGGMALLAADFYRLFKVGGLERSHNFIQWVGYYEAKPAHEARYREVIYRHLANALPSCIGMAIFTEKMHALVQHAALTWKPA